MPKRFVTNCVNSTYEAIHPMVEEAEDITRATFLRHVDRENMRELEQALGYAGNHRQGLVMAKDWHVSYHKSTYRGRPCVYFCWSCIEHVFCEGGPNDAEDSKA